MTSFYQDKNFKYTNPDAYDQRHKSNPLEYYVYSVWHDFLANEVKKYSREKIVADLGCGTCEYTQYMNDAKKIYAIDISPEMINFGKNKTQNLHNIEFLQESALNNSLENNSCDTIISFGLLEYVDPNSLLEEINHIIKAGGNLLILFPNKYNAHHLFMRFYGKLFNKKRKKELSLFEVKCLLKKYGFQIQETASRGMIFYAPKIFQKYLSWLWQFLDFIYKSFQRFFPLGCNIYIHARQSK